jgi:GNAT superfamily N-acetyltransferase
MTFSQIEVGTPAYAEALRLREEILRKPLNLALTRADLALETGCFHLAGFDGSQLVAVLLLQPLDAATVKMRQVAVRAELQKTGLGSQLIAFAEELARQRGYATIIAHARGTAVAFYLRLGYTAADTEFLEQTIPHRLVKKMLPAKGGDPGVAAAPHGFEP